MLASFFISFLSISIMVGSFNKGFTFTRLIFKGMLSASTKDVSKINSVLRSKKHPKIFKAVFIFIIDIKMRIFVKKSINHKKSIKRLNDLILNVNRYYERKIIMDRLAKILSKYDPIFYNKIHTYESPKSKPIIDFFHSVIKIKAAMPLTLNATEDKLILLIGNPIINEKLSEHKVDSRIIDKIKWLFGPRQDFLKQILNIAA